jgi:hypothetical protein
VDKFLSLSVSNFKGIGGNETVLFDIRNGKDTKRYLLQFCISFEILLSPFEKGTQAGQVTSNRINVS